MHRTTHATVAALLAAVGANAQDLVTISGGFYECGTKVAEGQVEYYRLSGQSVYFSSRTSSLTTGGQLDGIDCRDDELAQFDISFFEVFPEANLTDYLTFGYFGIVDTITAFDTDGDGTPEYEQLTDQSFVIATRNQLGEGATVGDFLPGYDEATLVNALTTSFDSPEFFDALFQAVDNPNLNGDIWLWQSNAGTSANVREGEQLSLIAFRLGSGGDEGQLLGYLSTAIINFPERLCADQNADGLVNPADFSAWIINFNANNPRADVNGDSFVSPADLGAWIAQYNLGVNGQKCLE